MIPADFVALALKNWKAVLGGAAIAILGVLLVIAKADASHWHEVADARTADLVSEKAAHAVTRQSVATLEQALATKNAETQARTDAFAKSQRDAAAQIAQADKRYAEGEARRNALEALAARAGKACAAPPELLNALEGM